MLTIEGIITDLRDMGLNIKHGLIDEQDINNIAGLLACRYIRPCILLGFCL